MHRLSMLLLACAVVCAPGTLSAELPQKESLRELHRARQTGWQLALVIVEKLEAGDQTKYPGIQAWLNDFREAANLSLMASRLLARQTWKRCSPNRDVLGWPLS